MKTIYVLQRCEHDYDHASYFPIYSTSDKNKMDAKVEEMKQRQDIAVKAKEDIQKNMALWRVTNPDPKIPHYQPPILPQFPGKRKHWTDEQKAAYKKAEDDHREASVAAAKPYKDWTELFMKENHRLTAALSQQVQEDVRNIGTDTFWEVVEVPYDD
jgi:hypothetical protein